MCWMNSEDLAKIYGEEMSRTNPDVDIYSGPAATAFSRSLTRILEKWWTLCITVLQCCDVCNKYQVCWCADETETEKQNPQTLSLLECLPNICGVMWTELNYQAASGEIAAVVKFWSALIPVGTGEQWQPPPAGASGLHQFRLRGSKWASQNLSNSHTEANLWNITTIRLEIETCNICREIQKCKKFKTWQDKIIILLKEGVKCFSLNLMSVPWGNAQEERSLTPPPPPPA